MSKLLINKYYTDLDRALQFAKSKNETSVRHPFLNLLNEYARKLNYELSPEVYCMGTLGRTVKPDGIIRNYNGLDVGLWESKDEKDTIDDEIDSKQAKGYPFTNILFEDTQTAVLIQKGAEVMRVPMKDADKLDAIITQFISFKSEYIYNFEKALEYFKADIPTIVETLRKRIDESGKTNTKYIEVAENFLSLCKAEINPDITEADIREMMIQHILTSDIFNKVFDDPEFHRHNSIAKELEKLIDTLFTYSERRNVLGELEHYYDTITAAAACITDHHLKQKFLKVLYENFYKMYNPKAADRLGVVYTPNEIVKFMIESTDFLLYKHFNTLLANEGVEILDPATGTGTFITAIIDNIPNHKLIQKYKNEIHANEVAILPYYVANLNMEFTYKQKMGKYEEYKNLCFVDTLDNTDALAYGGKQHDLFGLSTENSERIKNQNSRKISVVIGNPPYNANQLNENENNKNREYPIIDKRIKDTFIKYSTAQKTKVYDMYARFYRWAMDRVDKDGIISFITNNSFINSRTFDGFRKSIQEEFDYAYIIDLGGNIRELSGKDGIWMNEEHTVFGKAAAVGIAIMFLVKKKSKEKSNCQINYIHPCDIRATRIEKFEWLSSSLINEIDFENIIPDKNNNWINLSDNDFDSLLPMATKDVKLGRSKDALFELFSLGTVSNRDEWVYDFNKDNLQKKIDFFINQFQLDLIKKKDETNEKIINDSPIKYTRDLKKQLLKSLRLEVNKSEE